MTCYSCKAGWITSNLQKESQNLSTALYIVREELFKGVLYTGYCVINTKNYEKIYPNKVAKK